MNILLMKQIAVLSAIFGAIAGVITLIPYVGLVSFTVLILLLSPIVLVHLKRNELIGVFDLKEGALLGAEIGFVSFIAFSVIYTPLSAIIGLIFEGFNQRFLLFFMDSFSGIVVMIMLIFFLALLSALMNGFAGLSTAYAYEILSGLKKENAEHVNFEIK